MKAQSTEGWAGRMKIPAGVVSPNTGHLTQSIRVGQSCAGLVRRSSMLQSFIKTHEIQQRPQLKTPTPILNLTLKLRQNVKTS